MAVVALNSSTVKPMGDRVFIKVTASAEKTGGGLFLPDSAQEKPQVGEIASTGPGKLGQRGARQTLDVKVGDKVLYSRYAGTEIKLGDEPYILLAEKDILALIE